MLMQPSRSDEAAMKPSGEDLAQIDTGASPYHCIDVLAGAQFFKVHLEAGDEANNVARATRTTDMMAHSRPSSLSNMQLKSLVGHESRLAC